MYWWNSLQESVKSRLEVQLRSCKAVGETISAFFYILHLCYFQQQINGNVNLSNIFTILKCLHMVRLLENELVWLVIFVFKGNQGLASNNAICNHVQVFVVYTILETFLYCGHQMCGSFSPYQAILRHQLGVLQFNSILTLYLELPQVKGSVLYSCSPLQPPIASPGYYLCF